MTPGLARLCTLLAVVSLGAAVLRAQVPEEAAGEFQEAVRLFEARDYPGALDILEALEKTHSGSADIHQLLAIVLDLSGRPGPANEHFRRAVELRPNSPSLRANYGTSLMRLGRVGEAEEQFRAAVEHDTASATAHYNLGTLLLQRGVPAEARQHLATARRLQPGVYENSYQLAYCHFLLSQYEAADTLLGPLAATGRAESLLLKALTDRALGRADRTAEVLGGIRPHLRDRPHLQEQIGVLLAGEGLIEEALPMLESAATALGTPRSWLMVARLRLRSADPAGAAEAASRVLPLQESAEAHLVLAEALEAGGDSVEALQHFQAAARLEPGEEHLFALGYQLLSHWNWEMAQNVFAEAVSRHPESWRLRVGLGSAALGRNDSEAATAAFLEAVRLQPDEPLGYRLLAQSFADTRLHFEAALEAFSRFEQRAPEDTWARYYGAFGAYHRALRAGDLDSLAPQIERLARIAANEEPYSDARLLLGEIHFGRGEWASAASAFRQAVQDHPEWVQAHYKLGLALRRSGADDEARDVLALYQRLKADQDREVSARVAATRRFVFDLGAKGGGNP